MTPSWSRPIERSRPRGSGFTLIELLIVIAIIGILVGLVVAVAARVTQGGKKANTESIIRVLDQAYASWALDKQAKVPKFFEDEEGTQFPIVDGTFDETNSRPLPAAPESSLAFLLASVMDSTSGESMLKGIDPKLVVRYTGLKPDGSAAPPSDNPLYSVPLGNVAPRRGGKDMSGVTIKDAWGKPIRAVVPAFQGGFGEYYDPSRDQIVANVPAPTGRQTVQVTAKVKFKTTSPQPPKTIFFRRSYLPENPSTSPGVVGDADEGLCAGASPYFYSAGPDGDPGTRSDNAYAHKPSYPPETAKFNNN